MNETSIVTPTRGWTKLFSANTTASSITNPIPTITQPSGNGIIDFTGNTSAPSCISLAFIVLGSDDTTGTARVTGWRRVSATGLTTLWVPTPLSAISFTGGTQVGIAAAAVLNTERFADLLTESTAYTTAKEILTGSDETAAEIKIDTFGCEIIQVQLAVGTATSVNALWTAY